MLSYLPYSTDRVGVIMAKAIGIYVVAAKDQSNNTRPNFNGYMINPNGAISAECALSDDINREYTDVSRRSGNTSDRQMREG